MLRFLSIIILLGLMPYRIYGQELMLEIQDSIPGDYSNFSTDNFGRIYLTNKDVVLEFSAEGDTLFSTSLKSVIPTSIESSKSFRSLIFDRERSVIHFLDNTLTDIYGEIDLARLEILQAELVCESFAGNTFWVFDAGTMRLIKLNENLETVSITENLASVLNNEELPIFMREFNDMLFILLPGQGIAVFDVFGTFIRIIPQKQARWFYVLGEILFVLTDKGIEVVALNRDFPPLTTTKYSVPKNTNQFSFHKDKVYFLTDSGLYIGVYKKKE